MSIQSLNRAINILELFSPSRTHVSISEMSEALKLNVSTIHGIVRTLIDRGLLCQDPETRKYALGIKIFELNYSYLGCSKVYQFGAAPAHRLAKTTGLNTRLAVWDNSSIVVILEIFSGPETYQYVRIGPRTDAYFTSMGKAVLAFLPKKELLEYLKRTKLVAYTQHTITDRKRLIEDLENSRQRGYATDSEECFSGVFCAGAPIFDNTERVIASLSISGGSELMEEEKLSGHTSQLIQTSKEISHYFGHQPKIGPVSKSTG
jgi:DNA-binding IclR family transcriptional regulator